MQTHLIWYVLSIISLIIAIIYGAWSYCNSNSLVEGNFIRRMQVAVCFFLASIAFGILGIVQQNRDVWSYKMQMHKYKVQNGQQSYQ